MRPELPSFGCTIHTIAFRFEGNTGQRLEFGGVTYTIGKWRYIDLIANGETTYRYEGRELPINVWPADDFGFVHVRLPH